MTRNGIAYPLAPLARLTKGTASGSLPTPLASGGSNTGANRKAWGGVNTLEAMASKGWWSDTIPTPTSRDAASSRNTTADRTSWEGVHLGDTLTDYVTKWPTPRASDANGPGEHGTGGPDLRTAVHRANQPAPGLRTPGRLNPRWVEWLMGFPVGWVNCAPSETPSSPRSQSGSDTD